MRGAVASDTNKPTATRSKLVNGWVNAGGGSVASDCPDTDISIKLLDVYPPSADYPQGFAMNLTDGILRLRYR